MNVQYSIVSKCEKNSIIDKAINFYDQFVEKLTNKKVEKSYIYSFKLGKEIEVACE